MAALITQMGLNSCPVCDSDSALGLLPQPSLMPIGGAPWMAGEGNVLFMAVVRCESCGHTMLFDSEKFSGANEGDLWRGPTPPE